MNNNKIYAAFLVFLGLFLSGAAADEDAAGVQKGGVKYSLSVQDAVDTALKNNVSIKRQEITLNAAERSKNHSWNSLSPSISVGAAAGVPVDALSDSKSDHTASLGLSATASLSLSANLYTTMKSAKLNYEQSKISFEEALRTIEFSVRQSYYELIYEKENIKLQEANLKVAKQQYENNLAKYNSGRLSEVDALSAEVNYKAKIPTVESARASYQNAMDSFKQVLGLMIDDEVELTGSLNDYLYLDEIAVDEKTVTSSSIKNLELKIESAKTSVLDKRFSAFAPSLNASFKWEEKTWYAGYTGKDEKDPEKSASLTLSASIPLDGLLPWSSKNDAVDSAKDTLKDYELQLENEKKTFVRTIGSSLRSIKQSQEAIRYKQANVELAQRTYDMTLEAYNRGTKDLLTLQNANNTLLSAQLSLNSETLTLSKNILSLENTAGLKAGELVKK